MANQSLQLVPVTEDPYNAETPLSALLKAVTPLDLIYVRNHFEVPQLDAIKWSLAVNGAVMSPSSISYAEIQELPAKNLTVALECAGNGRKIMDPVPKGIAWGYGAVSIVEFTGTPVSNVLRKAGIADGVVEVAFHGADRGEVEPSRIEHYVRSLPLGVALNSDTLLVWKINGQPLSPQHGFPVRLVVPGWYGMASVKWLRQITALTEPYSGFFQNEDYVYLDEEGTPQGDPVRRVRARSLIISPGDGAILSNRVVRVVGIAWSGHGAISQVEVSTDGGVRWWAAELDPPTSPFGVQEWRYEWTPELPGTCGLVSRTTDSLGNSQPALQRWNRLGYGNNGPQAIVVSVS